jgi:hypothetical protein
MNFPFSAPSAPTPLEFRPDPPIKTQKRKETEVISTANAIKPAIEAAQRQPPPARAFRQRPPDPLNPSASPSPSVAYSETSPLSYGRVQPWT